jgi:hypothetical protein
MAARIVMLPSLAGDASAFDGPTRQFLFQLHCAVSARGLPFGCCPVEGRFRRTLVKQVQCIPYTFRDEARYADTAFLKGGFDVRSLSAYL